MFFFFSGCPIPQLNVFGDDISSVTWGRQSIMNIPAVNHIVSRVPAMNSITLTIYSSKPLIDFFGFETLSRRQQTHSLTKVSHLFVVLGIYIGLMAIPWSLPRHTHICIDTYIYIRYNDIFHIVFDDIGCKILYIISRQVVAMSQHITRKKSFSIRESSPKWPCFREIQVGEISSHDQIYIHTYIYI